MEIPQSFPMEKPPKEVALEEILLDVTPPQFPHLISKAKRGT